MRPRIDIVRPQPLKLTLTITAKPLEGPAFAAYLESLCFTVLGKDEMVTRGSRWRGRIRDNPGKLERVLVDVRSCQREGMHVRNPGAYAEDLWKRFV